MSLAEQFKQFVANQPPERTIDHTSYRSCAMGDFAKTIENCDGYDVASSIHNVYGHSAYMIIGNGGRPHEAYNPEPIPMANYGELSAWLNTLNQSEVTS